MAKTLLERLSNTKSRTLLLFLVVIVVVVILIIIMTTRKSNPLKTEESRTAKIPQITSVPGNVTSEKYQTLQEEDNRRRAEEAKKAGGSAVATIIGARDKDLMGKKDTFGIEGEFGACNCPKTEQKTPAIATLDSLLAAKLFAQLEANPKDALRLLKANPGLAKALCTQKPDLALKIMEQDKEAAKLLLRACPALAKILAEKDPALFKQLMLEDPELAKLIAAAYPEIIKKMMLDDPEFAKAMARINPDLVKMLMKNDPDFAAQMAKQYPDLVKDLIRNDPDFAKAMAKNNPGLVKKMLSDDPELTKLSANNNPDMIKDLIKTDPEFAQSLAANIATVFKELMKNDPLFADATGQQYPEIVKKLVLDDPEFAKVMATNNPEMMSNLMQDLAFARALLAKVPGINAIIEASRNKHPGLTDKQRLAALEAARQKQRIEQSQRAQQLQLNEQQQKQLALIINNMEAQSKAAFQSWNEIPGQVYVTGEESTKKSDDASGGSGSGGGGKGGSGGGQSVAPLIKAGSILFASLDTAVNSDEPGPVMATITQGRFQGAKVLGSLQLAPTVGGNRPEKLILNFDNLSSPEFVKSIPIKAVAIDPDTARTALSTNTEHHYLLRYGTLLASSFMVGYAKVISSEGTVVTQPGAVTGNTTTTSPNLSGRQQIFAALGEVGKRLGDATSTYFDTPNTISVDAGTGIGLLILSDVNSNA